MDAMKMLWHLLSADLRRVRLIFAAWLLIVSAAAVVDGVQPLFATNTQLREWLMLGERLLWLALVLTMFVMTAWVIQADPAVGSDAFWMTRPIPTSALLSSKLLLLSTAIIVIPTMGEAALLAGYDISFAASAGVLGQRLLNQALWLASLAIPAVLTANLARYALLCASVLLGVVTAIALVATMSVASAEAARMHRFYAAEISAPFDPTKPAIFAVCFIVASMALVSAQYGRRSRVRSVVTGAVGIAIAAAVAAAWPWPLLTPKLQVPAWALEPAALTLFVDKNTVNTHSENPMFARDGLDAERAIVRGRVSVSDNAKGWVPSFMLVDATVTTPAGTTLTSESVVSNPAFGWRTPGQPFDVIVGDLLGVKLLGGGGGLLLDTSSILFIAPATDFARVARMTADYRATFRIRLVRYEIDAVLPLRHHARHANGEHQIVIEAITHSRYDIAVVTRTARAASIWDRQPPSNYMYFLRSRRHGEALIGGGFEMPNALSTMPVMTTDVSGISIGIGQNNGFKPKLLMIGFPVGVRPGAEFQTIDDAWLADAELIVLRETSLGSVDRTVHIPDFPLVPPVIPPAFDPRFEIPKVPPRK